ncbi:hypothetical protein BJ165DRAFT_673938 [Panaeolus papilionaceus]|nr:hypothetical protein BJ165DRAFT_673938 [Panaeolus papilionaceus]
MYGHHPPDPITHSHVNAKHTSRASHDSSNREHVVSNGHSNGNGHTNGNGNSNGRRDILERRIAPGAFHDSKRTYDPPKCQSRSKNGIVSMIIQWLMDAGKDNAIMWMYGPAGSGKSSIMQSVSQYCSDQSMLAASFFFAKDSAGLNTEKHLMSTIAYQISHSIPETRRFIAQAIESDPSVFSGSLETQLQTLVVTPLLQAYASVDKRVSRKWARLLVIDGLDECQGANTQRYIVRILSTALIHKKVPLFILVSSQPEPPIRDSFNSYDLREAITTLVLDEHYLSDAEIRRYFYSRFDLIRQTHPMRAQLPVAWPSSESINHLISRAAGQFIYATTVIKYIQSPQHRPNDRLDALLRLNNPLQAIPFAELDCIYRHVFVSVHNIKGVLRILGALLFAQRIFSKKSASGTEVPIPVTDPRFLEELLSLNRGDVSFILGDLDSILNVPDSRKAVATNGAQTTTGGAEGIRILHSSLIDFLTDRYRAGKHFINSVKVHAELARACVRNMLSGEHCPFLCISFLFFALVPCHPHKPSFLPFALVYSLPLNFSEPDSDRGQCTALVFHPRSKSR